VGEKPYGVLQQVMADEEREAIAHVVFAGREQVALIRPVEKLLAMTLVSYDDEVKKPSAFSDELPEVEATADERKLTTTLIEAATNDKFDLAVYRDEYEKELAELIEAKASGKKMLRPKEREEPIVINLMDALRQSVAQRQESAGKRKRPARAKAKPAAGRTSRPKRRRAAAGRKTG
jgi:DNA end-binding protein Ku